MTLSTFMLSVAWPGILGCLVYNCVGPCMKWNSLNVKELWHTCNQVWSKTESLSDELSMSEDIHASTLLGLWCHFDAHTSRGLKWLTDSSIHSHYEFDTTCWLLAHRISVLQEGCLVLASQQHCECRYWCSNLYNISIKIVFLIALGDLTSYLFKVHSSVDISMVNAVFSVGRSLHCTQWWKTSLRTT